jgi:hypothetical protein
MNGRRQQTLSTKIAGPYAEEPHPFIQVDFFQAAENRFPDFFFRIEEIMKRRCSC